VAAVAVRTQHFDTLAWCVATVDVGGQYASDEDVEDWDDVYVQT
jgi:hypothetical protein